MNVRALHSIFVDELTRTNRKMRTLFDAQIKAHGLTLSRAKLLLHLAEADGATQSELADALEVEQPSMVGLIDALEKTGFVTREPVEGDRRAKSVFLTDLARREANEIRIFSDQMRENILNGICPQELCIASHVLRKVANNIGGVEDLLDLEPITGL